MGKTVDYYFSPLSPWSYLGHQRFTDIAAAHGATVNVRPIDFGRIFPVSGGLPLKQRAPQRQAYRLVELRRWREHLGIPLVIEPKFFPADAIPCTLAIIAADTAYGADRAMALAGAFMRGCWVEERNLGDAETVGAIVRDSGLGAERVLGAAAIEAARARFDAYNQQAIDAGVFGAPSYVVGGEIFWGQDRLDFVERALA